MAGLHDFLAPGLVLPYAGTAAPTGWLLCHGQAVSRATYAGLFEAIGTTYGAGNGSTTFNVPDLRGRVTAGKDDMGGTAASRLTNSGTGNPGINGTTLGATGGADRHTLTVAQMPSHTHNTYNQTSGGILNNGATTYVGSAVNSNDTTQTATIAAGSNQAHPNAQPTIVLNYVVKT